MDRELRILILEDAAADAELMEDEMKQANLLFISKRVGRAAFISDGSGGVYAGHYSG